MIQRTKARRLLTYLPDYVVFDLETTGFNPTMDDIIEISAIKVKNGEVIDTFSTLVNPERSIPYHATAVNGITDEMVKKAPVIELALPEFLEFIEDYVLVGHNIHTFDLKFINNVCGEFLGKVVENDYVDTLYMARTYLPGLRHYKLVDVSSYFNISSEGAHRAMNDCIMNQKCFEALGRIREGQDEASGHSTPSDCESSQGQHLGEKTEICPKCGGGLQKRKGKFGEFWGCGSYPNCRYTKNIN